jgi:hypothetical protein
VADTSGLQREAQLSTLLIREVGECEIYQGDREQRLVAGGLSK